MGFGIIAEGITDQAVIENILIGLGVSSADVTFIRPDLNVDETDRNKANPKTIGTWQGVKNSCLDGKELESYFSLEGNDCIIIQIDTAESGSKDFGIPALNQRDTNYVETLHELVCNKILHWLSHDYNSSIIYAVSVQEIEAWILTLYTNESDTCKSADPKSKLLRETSKKLGTMKGISNEYDRFKEISKEFKKKKRN